MKKIKRLLILVFMLTLTAAAFTACSKKDKTDADTSNEIQSTTAPTQAAAATSTPVPATATPAPTATPVPVETAQAPMPDPSWSDDMKEMKDITAVDLVKEIKIGWNLGNTMDATGNSTVLSEISWGNPLTSQGLIDAVKEAGFNTVRIPTSWEPHLGPAPDYIIDKAWLERIQQIVDYAMKDDMYVILNAHHDEWYMPTYANKDKALDMMPKVWKQIADHFQNYDEHLIFEGMNEPRMKGTNFEWNGGNAEGWDMVNQLNAKFVETIRNASGNNPLRVIMIPPYAATSSTNAWSSFVVPDDNKIIVSIHSYSPYNFALNKSGTADWSSANANDTRDIDNLMNNISNNFVSKGIPVILGEFGAMIKNDNTAARVDWATYYVSKAKEKGIPCIWWDNGAFVGNGELFGLIDRTALTWKCPEVVDALMKGLQ